MAIIAWPEMVDTIVTITYMTKSSAVENESFLENFLIKGLRAMNIRRVNMALENGFTRVKTEYQSSLAIPTQ